MQDKMYYEMQYSPSCSLQRLRVTIETSNLGTSSCVLLIPYQICKAPLNMRAYKPNSIDALSSR